ncbi:MAG: Hsp70 family protein, partial [Desulfamplus sp.]|nr:Hsp70 family protein [Desulfamplus sp.]
MKNTRYIVGIDLGTTNSVVAYSNPENNQSSDANISGIRIFKIPQLTDSGVIDKRDVLPSFLYIKDGHEISSESLKLPWSDTNTHASEELGSSEEIFESERTIAVGEFARDRGSEVPHKLISSSKSWLCNQVVDRESKILPWETTENIKKMSPVEASCAILSHIKDAWNYEIAQGDSSLELHN